MIVRENIGFQRGLDSKESLGVGIHRSLGPNEIQDELKDLFPTYNIKIRSLEDRYYLAEKDQIIRGYILTPELSIEEMASEKEKFKSWLETTPYKVQKGRFYELNDKSRSKDIFYRWEVKFIPRSPNIKENMGFKRGLNSKSSLNIGRSREISNITKEDYDLLDSGIYLFKCIDYEKGIQYLVIEKLEKVVSYKPSAQVGGDFRNSAEEAVEDYKENKKSKKLSDWHSNPFQLFYDKKKVLSLKQLYQDGLNESLSFKRGMDSKEVLGVGIKEENRDLDQMAKNFVEYFTDQGIEFLGIPKPVRRQSRTHTISMTERYPIYFRIIIDSKDMRKMELIRKRRQDRKWFDKFTPYGVTTSKKGNSFWNKQASTGFQMDYMYYLDDK